MRLGFASADWQTHATLIVCLIGAAGAGVLQPTSTTESTRGMYCRHVIGRGMKYGPIRKEFYHW